MYTLVRTKALLDGTGREPVPNGCILIEDGMIREVGTLGEFGSKSIEYDLVDLSDYYVLPGLIDSHTHLSIVPSEGNQLQQMRLPAPTNILRSMPNIRKNLSSGVTAMRIMGEEHFIDVEIKEAIKKKLIPGPRLVVSGRGLVASNGHGVAITTTDGKEEVRKHARQNLARGADFLKIFATGGVSSASGSLDYCGYTREEIATAVEEAERVGTYVAAHAHGGKGLDLCIDEGVRTIEHAVFITEEQTEKVIQKNHWLIGTFSILFHPTGIEQTDFNVSAIRDKVLQAREVAAENFHRVIKSGVNLAVGTDSMHGLISYELECLVNFGASPLQAIMAATKNAAKACRVEHQVGTLEVGKAADFIGVKENPLADIKHLRTVECVYQAGERVI
ncbi:metal-dependent hydrolase family protein [Aneurinibacillus tyrosinisolvens]|uniref:metal-dependent hydrolase family protein n=1 Tax=Aneurinibacillus tyrosinisolvens TaxID=1443435 RepID=UPI00063FB528|nr:amidohydrolase family protein [Aneurinibacillus tyrosinisolvens]